MSEFKFATRPDLGGTAYDYVHEFTRDETTYFVRDPDNLIRIIVPKDNSIVHISLENPDGSVHSESFYTPQGTLLSANIWFRRYCDQRRFIEKADPDDEIFETYGQLTDSRTDLMLEADLSLKRMGIYLCTDDSTESELNIISRFESTLPLEKNPVYFIPRESGEITPVKFFTNLEDNILSLGFYTNEKGIVCDTFSDSVNFEKLNANPTPGDIRHILQNALLDF